jgi:hypothetical protein
VAQPFLCCFKLAVEFMFRNDNNSTLDSHGATALLNYFKFFTLRAKHAELDVCGRLLNVGNLS